MTEEREQRGILPPMTSFIGQTCKQGRILSAPVFHEPTMMWRCLMVTDRYPSALVLAEVRLYLSSSSEEPQ